jgi:class 3 adenylate cyclase/tetratricopeptide (TPR) repeat protein
MAYAAAVMRKTVTVLFCDVAGSTELGERLDPEALRAVMTRWFDAMRTPVERAGGTVEKFVGDAVMAVFGVPAAHEDDAFRAVQAAVEMRDAAVPLGLGIRIGVNTGEVVTGDGATTLVTGDAVNTAKRLEEAAAPGEILIGAPTRRLVANATVLEPAGAVSAKGKREPVEAWRVVSTIAGATPYARRLDVPLVGRADELALLESEVDAAVRDRACRLVTVCAPAGVGKSRLAQELLARVDADVLSARCVPYGDGITFLPLRELLGEIAGSSNDEVFLDVRRQLQEKARRRPLLVCIEDVHWAQPAFLDLLEYVHGWARDAPITLLCLARPELYDLRPRWPGRMLTLEPLSTRESESLLDALDVPAAARARIVDAAEGNPLFLEQMVAMLADEAPADEMPPTIHALLTARLDRLEPFEQSVLQRAAVVGKDFSRDAVVELSPEAERAEVAATLLSLTRKELVRPDHSGFADDDGFRFRHALIRDAAYAEVPKGVRTQLHARFAAWLEPREATPELVGYHLEQAYRSGVELGAPDDELADRAFELLATAGRRAYARDDVKAAANLLQRAADLVRGDAEVLILLGSAYIAAGDFAQGRAALLEAQEAAAGDRRLELRAAVELGFHDALTGSASSTTQIVGVAERAIPMLRELGDDAGLSRAWQLVTDADVGGKWAERTTALERALDHAERAGDRRQRSSLVALLAQALHYGPTPVETAIVRCDELLAAAEGDRALAAALMSTLGGLNAMRGEFDRARSLWSQARTLYEELGLQHRRAVRSLVPAGIELLAGNPGAAERELRYGYDTLAAMGETWVRATIAAYLAAVLAQLERNDEAIALTRESEANSSDDDVVTQVVWRGARARALARTDPAAAKALALAAVERALATDFLDLRAGAYVDLAAVADPSAAAAAVAEYERKGNVVGAERARALATI